MPASPDAIHRLFFAVWPDDDVRGALADRARAIDMACAPDGRSTPPGRYHMTLLFLGSFQPLPPTLVENAIAAADTVRAPAFELVLDRAGSFQRSRVWWLGGTAPPALQVLHARLVAAVEAMGAGSPDHSPFVPHVTLGPQPATAGTRTSDRPAVLAGAGLRACRQRCRDARLPDRAAMAARSRQSRIENAGCSLSVPSASSTAYRLRSASITTGTDGWNSGLRTNFNDQPNCSSSTSVISWSSLSSARNLAADSFSLARLSLPYMAAPLPSPRTARG
jgi:2'-5' RNA ligase